MDWSRTVLVLMLATLTAIMVFCACVHSTMVVLELLCGGILIVV